MKKIKPLLPTLREKKRYLVYEVISQNNITNTDLSKPILNQFSRLYGETGLAGAGLIFINDKYNKSLNRGMVRVAHNYVKNLKAALAFVNEIDGNKSILRSVGVSGILRKAESKYLAG